MAIAKTLASAASKSFRVGVTTNDSPTLAAAANVYEGDTSGQGGVITFKITRGGGLDGTVVLTLIFLASFAVYYFANWKALADVWHVR